VVADRITVGPAVAELGLVRGLLDLLSQLVALVG
jgi:hypothetical protein